jgi:hypothetical protein
MWRDADIHCRWMPLERRWSRRRPHSPVNVDTASKRSAVPGVTMWVSRWTTTPVDGPWSAAVGRFFDDYGTPVSPIRSSRRSTNATLHRAGVGVWSAENERASRCA